MIERIKTITYEVRSHNQTTILSDKGIMIESDWNDYCEVGAWSKGNVKRMIWHRRDRRETPIRARNKKTALVSLEE